MIAFCFVKLHPLVILAGLHIPYHKIPHAIVIPIQFIVVVAASTNLCFFLHQIAVDVIGFDGSVALPIDEGVG